jgi:hypothetical protein
MVGPKKKLTKLCLRKQTFYSLEKNFKSILLNTLMDLALKETMNTEPKKIWKTRHGKLEKIDII